MQALVIRISRDGNVLGQDITVNFMLNKRKSKKAAGAKPQTPLGELSALPQTLLLSREGACPLPYPPPVVNIFIRPPLFQNPRSAPAYMLFMCTVLNFSCFFIFYTQVTKCWYKLQNQLATIHMSKGVGE